MPPRKKPDRAGLRARPGGRPGGLVRGRGRAVPGRPASRRRLAADRTAGDPAARVRAPGHDQDPDPVPSRDRPGAGPAGDPRHERGPARLAEGDPGGGRGGAAGAAASDPAATRALWEAWQQGPAVPFTLPERLPPLRVLLVWDNLAGHKTPEMVLWLCRHGIMPLYTPLGGS